MPSRNRRAPVPPENSPFAFSFREYEDWYDNHRQSLLEPARMTFVRLLNEWLDEQMSDLDRHRIQVSTSRVKNVARVWSKIQSRPAYVDQITTLDSIPLIVDDLVGVRIVCHNNVDMATLRELLATLPVTDEEEHPPLATQPDSEKRYVDEPKDSGYRAYHINLKTLIQAPKGWVSVTGELQARTLLQDGWGELTHEDTYKPGVALPLLATKLARRMADLLAAVDDLAQDLRDELDRLAQSVVEQPESLLPNNVRAGSAGGGTPESPSLSQALLEETKRVVMGLSKQASLAEVAQKVQSSFGTGITETWGGHGSFADLVRRAVPSAVVSTTPPGVVWPPGMPISVPSGGASTDAESDQFPAIVGRLRVYDKSIPAIDSSSLDTVIDVVTKALGESSWMKLENREAAGIRELNALSKEARDIGVANGLVVNRHHIDYVLKMLLFSGNMHPGIGASDIRAIAAPYLLSRASRLGLVEDAEQDRGELEEWLAAS